MSVKSYSYFDNNATIPTFPTVTKVMNEVAECGNTSGVNPIAKHWQQRASDFECVLRSELAAPEGVYEMIWGSGSTEANNTVIEMFCVGHPGSVVVTTKIEHKCLITAADQAASLFGAFVYYVSPMPDGRVSPDDVAAAVTNATRQHPSSDILVAVMHANNETGAINDVREIAHVTKTIAPNAFVYVDCAQTFGKLPVVLGSIPVSNVVGVLTNEGPIRLSHPSDVYHHMGTSPLTIIDGNASRKLVTVECLIDGMCTSAHKTGGPFGVGLLVISRRFIARKKFVPIAGAQNYGLRGGTYNMPGIIGFRESLLQMIKYHAKADEAALAGKGLIFRTLRDANIPIVKYTDYVSLASRPDKCLVYFETSSPDDTLPGTLLCSVVYNSCIMSVCNIKLRKTMEEAGVIVSVGSACNASGEGMSHVLKAMNCPTEVGMGVLRISSYMNTRREYERVASVLVGIFGSLKNVCVVKKK